MSSYIGCSGEESKDMQGEDIEGDRGKELVEMCEQKVAHSISTFQL